ncbi:MAG: FecR domain-containing protein [Proteobacteria bacterium]|nr:FecR domain-containing protein [Pseudomonadota bacterium]
MTSRFDNQRGGNSAVAEAVARAAAEWLVILSDADCTHTEREEFVEWLRRSNLHVEEFLRISQLTQMLAGSKSWPQDSVAALIEQAGTTDLNRVTRLIQPAEPRNTPPRATIQTKLTIPRALAAALLVGLVIAGVMMFDWSSKTYITNVGEMRSITLEDGSVVELNTRSSLRAHFSVSARDVELLEGEAIFKVAKNPHRPFRVWSGATQIVAVGTEFNVDAHNARTVVTVLEGRVRVTSRTSGPSAGSAEPAPQPIEVASGEQVVVVKHHPPRRVADADTSRATAWTERRLIFEEATLTDVAAEFARYNDKVIQILGEPLASKRITGIFNATDQASFVEFLRTHANVRVREDARGWVLEAGTGENTGNRAGGTQ